MRFCNVCFVIVIYPPIQQSVSQPTLLTQTDTAGWIKAHSERLCDKCELYEIGIWTVIYETFILLYLNI